MTCWNDVQAAIDACPIITRKGLKPNQTVITRAPYGNKQTWLIQKITPTGRIKGVRIGPSGDLEGEPSWVSKDCQQFRVMSDESIRLAKEYNAAKAAEEKRLLDEAAKARAAKEAYEQTVKGKLERLLADYGPDCSYDQSTIDDYREKIHFAEIDHGLGRPVDLEDITTDFADMLDLCETMLRETCYLKRQVNDALDELERNQDDRYISFKQANERARKILEPTYHEWTKGA